MDKIISNYKNLMELTRFYSLNVTLASCFVIFSYAYYSEKFTFLNFILLTLALCFVQMGANLFDCYIDVRTKLKQGFNFENMQFSTERKARLIRNGTFSLKQVELILAILFICAITIGIYFTIFSGLKIILFAIILSTICSPIPLILNKPNNILFSSSYALKPFALKLIWGGFIILDILPTATATSPALPIFSVKIAVFQ